MSKRAKAERQKFHNAWVAFQSVRVPVAQVGQKIGEKWPHSSRQQTPKDKWDSEGCLKA